MSISPINNNAQTELVPQTLLGYSSNGVSAIEITPTSITIAGDLTTTPIYVGISASTGLTTTLATGLDVNCDFNMNSNNITNVDNISSTAGNSLTITGDGGILMNSTNTGMNFTASVDDIEFNCNGNSIFLNSNVDINLNATSVINLTADDDITIGSVSKGVLINGGTGDAGNNDITLTTQNATLQGIISLQSGGDIQLNSPNAVISINSGDNTQVSCGQNFTIQTNNSTGLVIMNTGDLTNSGGVKWNNYPMGITFFNKWNSGFGYNTPNAWEMVKQNSISFPPQFLYGTWAVSFSINCSNVGSAPADKGLAIFFNFLDGGSNTYNGFSYNQNYPFANWFQPSTYTNTSQTPLSITYTDYFDFTGAVNNLELQLNWYADNIQTQNDFFVSTTFTLMTLI